MEWFNPEFPFDGDINFQPDESAVDPYDEPLGGDTTDAAAEADLLSDLQPLDAEPDELEDNAPETGDVGIPAEAASPPLREYDVIYSDMLAVKQELNEQLGYEGEGTARSAELYEKYWALEAEASVVQQQAYLEKQQFIVDRTDWHGVVDDLFGHGGLTVIDIAAHVINNRMLQGGPEAQVLPLYLSFNDAIETLDVFQRHLEHYGLLLPDGVEQPPVPEGWTLKPRFFQEVVEWNDSTKAALQFVSAEHAAQLSSVYNIARRGVFLQKALHDFGFVSWDPSHETLPPAIAYAFETGIARHQQEYDAADAAKIAEYIETIPAKPVLHNIDVLRDTFDLPEDGVEAWFEQYWDVIPDDFKAGVAAVHFHTKATDEAQGKHKKPVVGWVNRDKPGDVHIVVGTRQAPMHHTQLMRTIPHEVAHSSHFRTKTIKSLREWLSATSGPWLDVTPYVQETRMDPTSAPNDYKLEDFADSHAMYLNEPWTMSLRFRTRFEDLNREYGLYSEADLSSISIGADHWMANSALRSAGIRYLRIERTINRATRALMRHQRQQPGTTNI